MSLGALWANEVVQVAFWAFVKVMIILNTLLGVVTYLIYAERKHSDEEIYRARFARVQGRNLPAAIWEALDI